MRLENKVALITGAARGIGKSIALAYLMEGANVVLTDVLPILKNTGQELQEMGKGQVLTLRMDVKDQENIENVVRDVITEFGGIDILVNNAGVCRANQVVDTPEEEWDLVIDTNLKGVFLCSKSVAREMIKKGNRGKIIATASIMAKIGEAYTAHYTASKHGILGFIRCLAFELAPYGINVNAICPGYVDTDMERNFEIDYAKAENKTFEEVRKFYDSQVPLGRIAQPEDIAKVAVFLASSDSDYLTGQGINVCGGVVMW